MRRLGALGYSPRHAENQEVPGREVFKQRTGKRHRPYVCSVDTPNLHHLLFRGHLRTRPEEAQADGALNMPVRPG
ncbi:GrpB family protein [Deinococcus hopiensis]|uniref:GrpB family protein n=1 Tax=Deinococcus hopiensis TaxID=309885 RepID=UPI003CCBF0B5